MSNINVSFKNLEINVLDDEGVNILAYTVPEYQLSMNAKGMVRFIGELVEEVNAVIKDVEITNTSPDEESPKIDEIYYMVSENGIDTEQWSGHKLDDRNWKAAAPPRTSTRLLRCSKASVYPVNII